MTTDALTTAVRNRIALALEQLRNLYDEITRTGTLPDDTGVALAIAEHHIEAAQQQLMRNRP